MKSVFLLVLLTSSSAFADTVLSCTTKTREGHYVKTAMNVVIKSQDTLFVQPYDSNAREWLKGSLGTRTTTKSDGTGVYKGFNSTDMFGELSEGAADKGIYLYVSPDVQAGKNGWVTLIARGTEVGREKGQYSCAVTVR